MSTKPKLDDQTQAALSAIEEALKGTAPMAEPRLPEATSDVISVRRPSPEGRSRPASIPASGASETPISYSAPSAATASDSPPDEGRARTSELAPTAAANDDREVIGNLLKTMQAKPSSRPMVAATLASLLWAAAVGALAWWRLGFANVSDQTTLIERLA